MALGERADPFLGFNFLVEIDGLVVGGFTEVGGLQAELEVETFREGGQNAYMHKLPGSLKYPNNLTLKRGLTDSDTLWSWSQDVARGVVQRRNGSVVLRDAAGNEKWRWNFTGAYPVKWTGPSLRSTGNDAAVETLELAHNGLTKGS
jgi:phage tail-like protein